MPDAERVTLAPMTIRAAMARRGIAPMQLQTWWSPDTERDVRPLEDPEIQAGVRDFLGWLWTYCLQAEARPSDGGGMSHGG